MKLALYQGPAIGGDIELGFARIEMNLAAAAQAGASMAVFPELYLPGYNQPDLHQGLAQPLGGAWTKRLSDLASQYACGLTIGWAERLDETIYNSATCFDDTGKQCAHYRKIQLFGPMERAGFTAGDAYSVFEIFGQRAALLICYDVEFPQHCDALAREGVSLILVPTANPKGFEHVSRVLVPARAAEMRLTIVYANYCGQEDGLAYGGNSLIVGPDAMPLATAGVTETLLIADLSHIEQITAEILSQQNRDYRKVGISHDA
ncbi:carbon-nitrogen hydrolase family protein [Roseibium algae]|uniref:Carbon-nitrogen hydrolase family protein n=1 Tax=Roseibium algae TaxID=3123038 RepID=A0ABU8TQA2_9HYPH